MSRKLIIEHPLRDEVEDLENINYVERAQRRTQTADPEASRPQANRSQSPVTSISLSFTPQQRENPESSSQAGTRQRYHHLQVLDEDAENFKTKLDNLLNGFRSDTLSEFMAIKRALLEEQRQTIDSETKKFTRIVENRTNELDKTKEQLAGKLKELERSELVIYGLSGYAGSAKSTKAGLLLKSKYFYAFKAFKQVKDAKKRQAKMITAHACSKYFSRYFSLWKGVHHENKVYKLNNQHEEVLTKELTELTAKYNKEIDILTRRLNETQAALDEANKNTFDMQENLKKAFMRGVCALNFEAMSILQTKEGDSQSQISHDPFNQAETIANNMFNFTNKAQTFQSSAQQTFQSVPQQPLSTYNDTESRVSENSPKKNNIVFYQNPKLESKEAKWRDAPLVGQSTSKVETKPSLSSMIRQNVQVDEKENADENRHVEVERPKTSGGKGDEEGRVIKVNNGKSYAVGQSETNAKSSKEEKTTVNVNANKAAALRAQLGAKGKK